MLITGGISVSNIHVDHPRRNEMRLKDIANVEHGIVCQGVKYAIDWYVKI